MFLRGSLLLAVSLVLLVVVGCGAGEPKDEAFFWQVTRSTVSWGFDCSDFSEFRADLSPYPLNSGFAYLVRADRRTAVDLVCDTNRLSTCVEDPSTGLYSVAGTELTREYQSTVKITGTTCIQQISYVLRLNAVDGGSGLDGDLTGSIGLLTSRDGGRPLPDGGGLGLDGGFASCAEVDDAFRIVSTNDAGLNGCIFTISLGAKRFPTLP